MTKPLIRIIEGTNVIDREMTDAEYDDYQIRLQQNAALEQTQVLRQQARQNAIEKLASLGLTNDEIAALVGA